VLDAAASPRSCCVSNPRGISYDTSGQTEICNICEVVGWRRTEVFAVEGSEVLAVFGAVKGAVGRRYVVRVEFVSNGASTSIVDSSHMESIVFGPGDTAVGIRVPRYDRDTRYMARNSTLLMVRMVPENLDRWRFFTPDQVTVVIVVPEVGFERGDYSVQYHDPTATLCLVYSNTGGGHAQFNVSVSIASQGGDFSDSEIFSFTQDSGRACVSISIPPSEITDPFSDTVFTAAIQHSEDFPFVLGPLNSAAVTLLALREIAGMVHKRLVVLGLLSLALLSAQAQPQMFFCFEGFGGTCSGDLLGAVSSPEDCCFTPNRNGLGGGAYVAAGDEQCRNCMDITGTSPKDAVSLNRDTTSNSAWSPG
jgi:hypothetical protein